VTPVGLTAVSFISTGWTVQTTDITLAGPHTQTYTGTLSSNSKATTTITWSLVIVDTCLSETIANPVSP
jgi:hypothetical protein